MMAKIEASRMSVHRTVLAAFLALAVAVAPVASALAVTHAPTGQAMEDCPARSRTNTIAAIRRQRAPIHAVLAAANLWA